MDYIFLFILNPLHPDISMHILHTVLDTSPKVLTGRICLTFKSFLSRMFCDSRGPGCQLVKTEAETIRQQGPLLQTSQKHS